MRCSIAPVAFAAVAAALPQGVTEAITPSTSAPAGCSGDYPGTFQIQVVNVTAPAKAKRQDPASAGAVPLELTLAGGILKDAQGRIGYIAANRQFQFDGPPQTGAIYTAGWSVCGNNSLAIGSDAVFQQCLSGTFYNLYDEATEEQCSPVYIEAINGGRSAQTTAAPVSQIGDGQPQATGAVQQIPDGQVQQNPNAVQQIPDGQIQQPTGSPIQQIPDGQIQQPTGSPISQIPDGQIQAPTGSPVSQIPDGQVQAPTGTPVQQIPDGQVQQPTGSPVQQIPDGQVQAPTNGSVASPTIQPYTGAGSSVHASLVSFVAAVAAAVFFL